MGMDLRRPRLSINALILILIPTPAIGDLLGASSEPLVSPRRPDYRVSELGSVSLSVCYNWSCAEVRRLELGAKELTQVVRQMDLCQGDGIHDRLQRLRIGVWGMELLAMRYIPALGNDRAVNDRDADLEGRTDCVDNASNTSNFLALLAELGAIPGWTLGKPRVRDLFTKDVHWTATVMDQASGATWAVDSWFRHHGHLPFVSPVADWETGRKPWEPPLDRFNPYPEALRKLCPAPGPRGRASRTPG